MFWWFRRGDDYVRYEARRTDGDTYELRFVDVDGTERVEVFHDEAALAERERELAHDLVNKGWTGPHGWNL